MDDAPISLAVVTVLRTWLFAGECPALSGRMAKTLTLGKGLPRHFQAFSKPSKPSRKVIERTHVYLIRIHRLLRTIASLTGEMDFIETNGQNSSLGESLPKPSRLLKASQKQSTCTLCAFLI